ncbi:MAG TPA: ATP-binding protein, partial [Rhodothermales bacterium]|nr:ATP-binding protein [Rhodothermales bacterium]
TITPLDTELRQRHVSGAWRWTTVRAAPLRNPAGEVYGWVGMNADITARKQAEEDLRALTTALEQRVVERTRELERAHAHLRDEMTERQRMQEALFQREKLAALGLLLANVAHELNNPLAVATIEMDNLAEAWSAELESEGLDTLRQAIERCDSVVQSFLALARQQPTTRQSLELNALIDEVLVLLRHALEADNIALELRLADGLPLLQADANQLHHVISNLIANAQHALKHSEPPRQLTLTTTVHPEGAQVTLEVADTGPGIPEDIQHRIFEPFFTTRAQDGGSGLGLPLCRSIIEAHGGAIRLDSQVGQGTTVRITLPVAPPAATAPAETACTQDSCEFERVGLRGDVTITPPPQNRAYSSPRTTAQAIYVPQEAPFCCEFGDGSSDEPATDSRGHLCPRFSWGLYDEHGVPRHFPGAGGRLGKCLAASGRAAGDDALSPETWLVSLSSSPVRLGRRGSRWFEPADVARS